MTSARERTIAAVIPASDPGDVARTIRRLPALVDRAYVVDNGTTDPEWLAICRLVAEAGQTDRDIDRIVAVPRERDTGTGIETGYLRALEDGVDMTIVLDSGRADPAAIAPHIASIVEDVDGLQPLVAIDPVRDLNADDTPARAAGGDDTPPSTDADEDSPARATATSAARSEESATGSAPSHEPAEIENV